MARDQYELKDKIVGNLTALMMRPAQRYTGLEIQKIRRSYNLSREAMAVIFNISPSTIRSWENGLSKPGGAALRLVEVLHFNGPDFFVGSPTG